MSLSALIVAALRDPEVVTTLREAIGAPATPRWLPLADAAELAGGIDPRVISDDARRGRITLGHAGRTPVVELDELRRWIESRPTRSAPSSFDEAPASQAKESISRAVARMRRAG